MSQIKNEDQSTKGAGITQSTASAGTDQKLTLHIASPRGLKSGDLDDYFVLVPERVYVQILNWEDNIEIVDLLVGCPTVRYLNKREENA